jgi:hypothetical protein
MGNQVPATNCVPHLCLVMRARHRELESHPHWLNSRGEMINLLRTAVARILSCRRCAGSTRVRSCLGRVGEYAQVVKMSRDPVPGLNFYSALDLTPLWTARGRSFCAALASVGRPAVPAKRRRPLDGIARDVPPDSRLGRRPCTATGTRCERECPAFPRRP